MEMTEQSKWKEEFRKRFVITHEGLQIVAGKTDDDGPGYTPDYYQDYPILSFIESVYEAGKEEGRKEESDSWSEASPNLREMARTATLKECIEIAEGMKSMYEPAYENEDKAIVQALSDYQEQLKKLL